MTSPALKFVRSVWSSFLESSGLEPRLLQNVKLLYQSSRQYMSELTSGVYNLQLKLTHAEPGKVQFEIQVEKHHTNRLGILHGGTIASMVDLGGSLAVASKGLYSTGVSADLNVTYLSSGGGIGKTIRAEAICDKFGKTLAFTTISFRNDKNQLVARGSHTKYVKLAWGDKRNIVDQLTDVPKEPSS